MTAYLTMNHYKESNRNVLSCFCLIWGFVFLITEVIGSQVSGQLKFNFNKMASSIAVFLVQIETATGLITIGVSLISHQ